MKNNTRVNQNFKRSVYLFIVEAVVVSLILFTGLIYSVSWVGSQLYSL